MGLDKKKTREGRFSVGVVAAAGAVLATVTMFAGGRCGDVDGAVHRDESVFNDSNDSPGSLRERGRLEIDRVLRGYPSQNQVLPSMIDTNDEGLVFEGAESVFRACQQIMESRVEDLYCERARGSFSCYNAKPGEGLLPVVLNTNMPPIKASVLPDSVAAQSWQLEFFEGESRVGEETIYYDRPDELDAILSDYCNAAADLLKRDSSSFKSEEICSAESEELGVMCDLVADRLEMDDMVLSELYEQDRTLEQFFSARSVSYFREGLGSYDLQVQASDGSMKSVSVSMEMRPVSAGGVFAPRRMQYSFSIEGRPKYVASEFSYLLEDLEEWLGL